MGRSLRTLDHAHLHCWRCVWDRVGGRCRLEPHRQERRLNGGTTGSSMCRLCFSQWKTEGDIWTIKKTSRFCWFFIYTRYSTVSSTLHHHPKKDIRKLIAIIRCQLFGSIFLACPFRSRSSNLGLSQKLKKLPFNTSTTILMNTSSGIAWW